MAGYGQSGYCKVCASELKAEINKRLKRGETYPAIMAWAKSKGFPISKPTLIKHKQHITDPKTTFVEEARKRPEIKRVTHTEFLQSVVDTAAAKVAESPDEVTLDHGLRAAQALGAQKDRTSDAINVLVLALTGNLRPQISTQDDVIEGDYRVVPALPVPEEEPVGA
jgi:hypothetical protein